MSSNPITYRTFVAKPPKYLYKYFRNLDFAYDALTNKRVHFELPFEYNDIFDSAMIADDKILNRAPYQKGLLSQIVFVFHIDFKEQVRNILESVEDDKYTILTLFKHLTENGIPSDISNQAKKVLLKQIKNARAFNNKITCFSECNDSLLMWAHYTDNLRGVCLCFDTEKDPTFFSKAYKVNYSKYRTDSGNFECYFTKALDWSYEQEWRIVVDMEGDYIPTNSCVGIIFGEQIDLFSEDKINKGHLMLYALKNNIQIFDANSNPTEYKIDIVKKDPINIP